MDDPVRIGELGDPSMKPLAPLLVCLLLGGLALAADTDALIQKLKSPNPEERREAAKGLADLGPEAKSAARALTVALGDKDRFVRRFAAQALGAIGQAAAGTASDPLGKAMLSAGESKEVQEAAAQALGSMGSKGLDPLVVAVKTKRLPDSVRQKATESIGNLKGDGVSAVPALMDALQDPVVRFSAVTALGQIGPPAKSAEKQLRDLLENKQLRRDKALRSAVQGSLKKIGGKESVQPKK